MPEVTPETQVADDLDQRVESLLKQMEDAAHQAADIAAESEAQAASAPPIQPTPVEADLASQVDQLLADAAKAAGDSPAAEAPKSIGSLDDELAQLASELIEGDVHAGETPPAPGPIPAQARAPARAGAPAARPPDPTIGDPPDALRPSPAAAPAVQPPVAPARAPLWRRALGSAKHWGGITARAIRRHAPTALAVLEPIAFRFASLVSTPLRNRPALVRDAIGWIALGTTFWASCIFVYFLFIYQPNPPAPTSVAVSLLDPSQPAPAPEAAAPEPKEAAPAHESSEHEGGKPAPQRKSPLNRPDKSPLNRPAVKPPEKKSGGEE